MYHRTTPFSPPYTVEEEDGNCVIVAPLGTSPVRMQRPADAVTTTTTPSQSQSPPSLQRPRHASFYGGEVAPPSVWIVGAGGGLRDEGVWSPLADTPDPPTGRPHAQASNLVSTPRHRSASMASATSSVFLGDDRVDHSGCGHGSRSAVSASPAVVTVRRATDPRASVPEAAAPPSLTDLRLEPSIVASVGVTDGADVPHRGTPMSMSRPPLPPSQPTTSESLSGAPCDATALVAGAVRATAEGPADGAMYTLAHGPGRLGPLILVRRPHRNRMKAADAAAPSTTAGELTTTAAPVADGAMVVVTPAEARSYRTEHEALRQRLEAATDALRLAEQRTEAAATAKAQALVEEHRQEERRRRRQTQQTVDTLREQCAELTAQLEAARLHQPARGGSGSTGGAPSSAVTPVLQAEWGRQLQEVEVYWRQRLRTATQHWESELDAQAEQRAALQSQVRELTKALERADETLRQRESERRTAGASSGADVPWPAPMHDNHAATAAASENVQLRQRVREMERRQQALLTQVESYAEEKARLEASAERKTAAVRLELEKERERNRDLVKLYSAQVQSLHQQLHDTVTHRNELAARLKR